MLERLSRLKAKLRKKHTHTHREGRREVESASVARQGSRRGRALAKRLRQWTRVKKHLANPLKVVLNIVNKVFAPSD